MCLDSKLKEQQNWHRDITIWLCPMYILPVRESEAVHKQQLHHINLRQIHLGYPKGNSRI